MNREARGVERRTNTQEMVDKLLSERQELLVQYCKIAGLEPFHPERRVEVALQTFCEILVDYTAFGHFELFQRISEGRERRQRVMRVAGEIYPVISEITEDAVAFNDRYDGNGNGNGLSLHGLASDLSRLGELLAQRFELEDRLVEAMVER